MAKKYQELREKMPAEDRAESKALAQDMLRDMLLSDIRKAAGMTQIELAEALGIQQSAVSKLEKQGNMQIGTLRRIIETYGGELEVIAHLPQGDVKLSQFTQAGADPTT